MMLFSDGGREARYGAPCQVDHVERDDARIRRAGANARDQVFEIDAPLPDLRVDVAVDVVAAAARKRRAADHVGVVAAGEDRHVRGVGRHKRRLPLDEVAGDIADRLSDVAREIFDSPC
jgi:hypothetical protein